MVAATKELSQLEHSTARMTVTLRKDELQAAYKKRVAELLKECQVPGFRKGHVPQAILERKTGPAFKEEIFNQIIGETTQSIFDESGFPEKFRPLPFRDPELEGAPAVDFDNDLVYSLVFDIAPETRINACEGLTIELDDPSITSDDLDRELEKFRERNAIVVDRDEGDPSQPGDVVTVNFCELDKEGRVRANTKREDFVFELGTKRNVYQFDNEITGMKAGEEREFEKSYAADEAERPEFAGKTIRLQVKTTRIKRKELPALDDELAQDIDEQFKTLDDLKKDVRERMQNSIDVRMRERRNSALLEKISENTEIEIPESFIEADMRDHFNRLVRFGIDPNALTEQDRTEIRQTSEARIRNSFINRELTQKYSIEISEDELRKEFERISENSGKTAEEAAEIYQSKSREQFVEIEENLKKQKLFALLAEKNTIKKGKKITYLDLFSENA